MNKLYDLFERNVLIGNQKLQWLFESLHRFSLRGMNYDQVSTVQNSGELFVIDYLRRKTSSQQDVIIFDVGANVGEYSKTLSDKFPNGRIFSFEALPATFEILKGNLRTCENVTLVNYALGDQEETRAIYTDGAGSGLTSFYPRESMNQPEAVHISVTTVDLFCEKNNISNIDFLKIDVEGFEFEVLKGAEKMISSGRVANIQFEFGENYLNTGIHLQTFFQFLSAYNVSRVLRNGLRRYEHFDKIWEVYSAANYLAELR
jgi:FkbM family methyltransferase